LPSEEGKGKRERGELRRPALTEGKREKRGGAVKKERGKSRYSPFFRGGKGKKRKEGKEGGASSTPPSSRKKKKRGKGGRTFEKKGRDRFLISRLDGKGEGGGKKHSSNSALEKRKTRKNKGSWLSSS